uniref:Chitin-binding type-2 domain-containing protein n=1 Tax=Anopheles maculatus TaxID=74869 RepID=A0A182SEE2_9DIPT
MKLILLLVVFGIVGVAHGTESTLCTVDARCPLVDNPSIFHSHADCNRFYQCSYGRVCEKTCPTGLHWSALLQRCEWPTVACCDPSVDCTAAQNPPGSITATPAPITTSTTVGVPDTQCTPDVRCPINDNAYNPLLLSHETNCGQFYKCSYGTRCLKQCQTGQHFSVQLQRCEWPQFACCDATVPCQQLGTTSVIPTDVPIEQCFPDSRCPLGDDPLKPLLLPVTGNCGAFYKCRVGDACLLTCPTGQHFSEKLQVCERPEVACCNSVC